MFENNRSMHTLFVIGSVKNFQKTTHANEKIGSV